MIKKVFFDFIGSCFMIVTLDSIHRMSQKFIIPQNIFVFVLTCCCNIFIHTLCFFYAHYHHLPQRKASLALIQEIF